MQKTPYRRFVHRVSREEVIDEYSGSALELREASVSDDTLMRCLAYAVLQSEARRGEMRDLLLDHFVTTLVGDEHIRQNDSVDEADYSAHYRRTRIDWDTVPFKPLFLGSRAIESLGRGIKCVNLEGSALLSEQRFRDECRVFVEQNGVTGNAYSVFVLLLLFSDCFRMDVYLWDEHPSTGDIELRADCRPLQGFRKAHALEVAEGSLRLVWFRSRKAFALLQHVVEQTPRIDPRDHMLTAQFQLRQYFHGYDDANGARSVVVGTCKPRGWNVHSYLWQKGDQVGAKSVLTLTPLEGPRYSAEGALIHVYLLLKQATGRRRAVFASATDCTGTPVFSLPEGTDTEGVAFAIADARLEADRILHQNVDLQEVVERLEDLVVADEM